MEPAYSIPQLLIEMTSRLPVAVYFTHKGKEYLVPGGQNIYRRGDDKASSTLLKRLDLCPSGPESTSTTELKNEASFENQISRPKLHGTLSTQTHLQIAVGQVCVPY